MICTEQEAATKWCPQVRYLAPSPVEGAGAASFNRSPFENDPAGGARCIGSACMMWVWVDVATTAEWTNDFEVVEKQVPAEERRGTCGLIQRGKP